MKNYLLLLLISLSTITELQAQRMFPKQKSLEITTGILSAEDPTENYYFNLGLLINTRKGNYKLFAIEYAREYSKYKQIKIPHDTYSLEAGYGIFLFGDGGKSISLNAVISGVVGYESINAGNNLLFDGAIILNKENIIYGSSGRLSLETYLWDRFVLLLQVRAKVFWGTSMEQFRPSAGLGLRYNF